MSSVMIVIRKSMTISPIEPHNTQGTIRVVRSFDASYVRYVFHKRENERFPEYGNRCSHFFPSAKNLDYRKRRKTRIQS